MKQLSFDEKIQLRMQKYLDRWQQEVQVVQNDLETYTNSYKISKKQIILDVSKMKSTFKQIENILKEVKR